MFYLKNIFWTSLVLQRIRIFLPLQGPLVRSLVWENSTCRGVAKPTHHSDRAHTLGPASCNYRGPAPRAYAFLMPKHSYFPSVAYKDNANTATHTPKSQKSNLGKLHSWQNIRILCEHFESNAVWRPRECAMYYCIQSKFPTNYINYSKRRTIWI